MSKERWEEVFEECLRIHLNTEEDSRRRGFPYFSIGMESPIEKAFAAALFFSHVWGVRFNCGNAGFKISLPDLRDVMKRTKANGNDDLVLAAYPQFQVGPYRLDFLIAAALTTPEIHMIAIECDGHDFHEKTKDQAARDKKRDRYLVAQGIRVLHFTGAEIHRDARKCVAELTEILDQIAYDGTLT